EQVAQSCGFKPSGKVCKAAHGLIEEGAEAIEEGTPGPVLDAMLICAGQKFEHYEIANYGTAKTWAELMGNAECINLLDQTLKEEEQTNQKLTQIAEGGVNEAAMSAPETETPKRRAAPHKPATRSATGRATTSRSRAKTTA